MSIESNAPTASPGKYLAITLAGESYGIPAKLVSEVIPLQPISRIPNTPEHVAGAINLRGGILPVMDLRVRLGMPQTELGPQACIVVLRLDEQKGGLSAGILAENVQEVLDLTAEQIHPTPDLGQTAAERFVIGSTSADQTQRMLLLLDVRRALTEAVEEPDQS
jgi:purine-binding chemotaxis protein CheW